MPHKRSKHNKVTIIGDKEKMKEKEKSALYQLYKPHLKDDITVKLRIGGTENIDESDSKYFLCVKFPYSVERFNETTSKIASKQPLQWNEYLTFHIDKLHLQDSDITCSKLVFELKKHDPTEYFFPNSECEQKCYLRDILMNKKVIFKNSPKEIMVYITKVEFDHQPDVRVRDQLRLCEDEEIFCKEREKFFEKEFKEQKENKSSIFYGLEKVPKIAVIGSGGGMRAVVGMCGAMKALKKLGILDAAMYTAGVSGSAWYLSTLYARESGFDTERVNDSIQNGLEHAPDTFMKLIITCMETFMCQIFHETHMSLTEIFGNEVGNILLEKNHKQKWSDLRGMLQHAELPLPLLAAMHVRDSKTKITDFHEWIECSPYEVFMPKYGTGIDMKHFGSEFDGGFVTKRKAEQSIRFLQGICGSAYAEVLNYHRQVGNQDGIVSSSEKQLENIAINFFEKECLGTVPNWLHGIPTFKRLFTGDDIAHGAVDKKNKRAENKELDRMKEIIDQTKQNMTLADAGTVCNSPYPLVLHPARHVDVIISFDFSQNLDSTKDNVGELIKAETWAKSRGLPFPDVQDEIKANPIKEDEMVRVFKNDNSPYILHFMMNAKRFLRKRNSGSADLDTDKDNEEEKLKSFKDNEEEKLKSFKTMKLKYSKEEFNWLSGLMEFNVKESEIPIWNCILEASKTNQG